MEWALADCLLKPYVLGTIPRPVAVEINKPTAGELKAQAKWDETDGRAAAKLGLMCASDVQQVLDSKRSHRKTSHELYLMLKERFTPSGMAAKWTAIQRLSEVTYTNSKDIPNMTTRMKAAWIELKDLEVTIDDFVFLTLLNNLGPGWSDYRTILHNDIRKTSEKLDWESITKGLEEHEIDMKKNGGVVNFVKGSGEKDNKGQGQKDNKYFKKNHEPKGKDPKRECKCCGGNHGSKNCRFKDTTCNNCGKKGHIKKICRSPKKDDKDKAEGRKHIVGHRCLLPPFVNLLEPPTFKRQHDWIRPFENDGHMGPARSMDYATPNVII